MNRFPKIDEPCPLGIDEQKRIDGYCGRCEKGVHSLDAMSNAEREALLSGATGPICVSYHRAPLRYGGAGLGAAMALALVVLPAAATQSPAGSVGDQDMQSDAGASASALSSALHPPQSKCHDATDANDQAAQQEVAWEMITIGGVSRPGDAEWVDDESLPDLPVIRENDSSGR